MKEKSLRHIQGIRADFSKSFLYSIHQVYFLVEKRLSSLLQKSSALSFSQFMILVGFKCQNHGPVSQTCIADQLHLTEATVSRHISILVSQKYLTRKEDLQNRRKHIITLTEKGNLAFEKAQKIIHRELTKIFSVVKENDRDVVMKNFDAVISLLLTKK